MNKKIIPVISAITIITLSFIILANINSVDHKILEQIFVVSAVYFDNVGYAEINFQDKSIKTKHVTLEILGMPESFHKEYATSSFVEKIKLSSEPKYGWQSIPVTLFLDHEEFGKISIKTEIRPFGDVPAKIIFSKD